MQRKRILTGVVGVVAMTVGLTTGASAAAAGPATPAPVARSATLAATPIVDARVDARHVTLSGQWDHRPGLVTFRLHAIGDEQEIVLVHLHPGYSLAKYEADDARAEGQGDAAALARVRANRDVLGNVDTQPGRVETFTVGLGAGTYYLHSASYGVVDPHRLVVSGAFHPTDPPLPTSVIDERDNSIVAPTVLARSGRILVANQGRYPHLLCMYGVEPGTTRAQVLAYLNGPGDSAPTFATGVLGCSGDLEPGGALEWGYSRPAGRYLLLDPEPDPRADGAFFAAAGDLRFVIVR